MCRIHPHGGRAADGRRRGPDERERGARLTPQAASGQHVIGGTTRQRSAADRADAADAAADRHEQTAGAVKRHLANRSLEEHIAAGHQRPCVAAVGRLVDPDSSLRIARRVLLAGRGIQRVAARVVGIEQERSDGVGPEAAGDELPLLRGIGMKCLRRSPDAAARGRHKQSAVTLSAVGRQRQGRDAPCGGVRRRVAEGVQDAGDRRDARPHQLPGSSGVLAPVQ